MRKVFIVNQPAPTRATTMYDISPAMQYGEVVLVFTADLPKPSDNPKWAISHAYEVLKDMQHDDFIVWAGGDPFGMVIVAAIAAKVTHGRFKYLRWERQRIKGRATGAGYYAPVPVDIDENIETGEENEYGDAEEDNVGNR